VISFAALSLTVVPRYPRLRLLASLMRPLVERPYRIPLNTFGCILFIIPSCVFLIFLMLIASKMTYVYFFAMFLVGFGFHVFQKFAKHYHLIEYAERPPKRSKKKTKAADA